MTPPPMTSRRFGISRRLTASLAPITCLPSNLNVGISIVDAPVASTMPFVASTVSVPPSGSVIFTVLGPVMAAVPIISSAPFILRSWRTPPVRRLTMPSFQSCILLGSTSTPPTLMPIERPSLALS